MGARVGPRSEDHAARNVVRGAVRDASRALSADGPARRASWGDSLGDDRVGSSDHARLFSDGIGPDGVGGSMGRAGPAYHERVWYARYVLVLLLLTYLFNQADRYAFAIGAKDMEQDLDFDGVAYSLLAGPIFVAVYSVTGIGTGYLADRARRTWLLAGLLASWSGVTLLVGYATSFWQVALLRGCQGLCEAGCTPLANGLIGDYFAPAQRGAALGVYNWGIYMGYGAAYGVGNIITRDYGWRAMFKFFGLPGVVVAAALACVHEPQRGRLEPDDDDDGRPGAVRDMSAPRDAAASGGGVGAGRSTRKAATAGEIARYWCKAGPLVLLCVAGAVRNAGGYVWAYNTNLFFENVHHQSAAQIAAYMGWIPLVAGSVGAVFGGVVSDRVVKNGTTRDRLWVLIISQVCAAPFSAGALFLPVPYAYLTLIPGNIIGEMWVGVCLALVIDLVPPNMRASSLAVYFFIIANIGGNSPVLVPVLARLLGERYALVILYPGMYLLSAVLFSLTLCAMRRQAGPASGRMVSQGRHASDKAQFAPLLAARSATPRTLSTSHPHPQHSRSKSWAFVPLLARAGVDDGGIGVTPEVDEEVDVLVDGIIDSALGPRGDAPMALGQVAEHNSGGGAGALRRASHLRTTAGQGTLAEQSPGMVGRGYGSGDETVGAAAAAAGRDSGAARAPASRTRNGACRRGPPLAGGSVSSGGSRRARSLDSARAKSPLL